MDRPPFPGPEGIDLYNHISAQAWEEWLAHQTRLINEKHLELFDPQSQQFLKEQRALFLQNKQFEQASGYVGPQDADADEDL